PRVYDVTPVGPAPTRSGPRLSAAVSSFPLTVLVLLLLWDGIFLALNLNGAVGVGGLARPIKVPGGGTAMATPRVWFETGLSQPGDTALLLALWAWCGWRLLRGDEKPGRRFAPAE